MIHPCMGCHLRRGIDSRYIHHRYKNQGKCKHRHHCKNPLRELIGSPPPLRNCWPCIHFHRRSQGDTGEAIPVDACSTCGARVSVITGEKGGLECTSLDSIHSSMVQGLLSSHTYAAPYTDPIAAFIADCADGTVLARKARRGLEGASDPLDALVGGAGESVEHSRGVAFWQAPFWQVSSVVQESPSLQGSELFSNIHSPMARLQLSVVQTFPSSQILGVP